MAGALRLAATGRWLDLMRAAGEFRDPDAVRRMPFCTAFLLFSDLTPHYERAVNADRALVGLPPVDLEDFCRGTPRRPPPAAV